MQLVEGTFKNQHSTIRIGQTKRRRREAEERVQGFFDGVSRCLPYEWFVWCEPKYKLPLALDAFTSALVAASPFVSYFKTCDITFPRPAYPADTTMPSGRKWEIGARTHARMRKTAYSG